MAIIYIYPEKISPAIDDLLLITDNSDQKKTKSAKIGDLPFTNNTGTVISVALTMPSAFSVANSPITINGTLEVTPTGGSSGQYLDYTGNWSTPSGSGGGAVDSVNTTDGTYINLTPNSATTGAVTVTADLSATDGTSDTTTRFLSKDNTWDVPSYTTNTNTTYTLTAPSANQIRLSDGSTNDDISLSAGSGITLSQLASNNITFANSDKGSSQNIYKNFTASTGGTAAASSNNDTLTLAAGTGITTTRSGDTITIATSGSPNAGGQTPVDYAIATGTDVFQQPSNPTQYFYIFTCHGNFTLSKMYWYQHQTNSSLSVSWGIYQGDLTSATLLGKGTATTPSVGINNVTIVAETGQNLNLVKGNTYVIAYSKQNAQGTVACKTNAISESTLAVSSTATGQLPATIPDDGITYSATTFRPCASLVP